MSFINKIERTIRFFAERPIQTMDALCRLYPWAGFTCALNGGLNGNSPWISFNIELTNGNKYYDDTSIVLKHASIAFKVGTVLSVDNRETRFGGYSGIDFDEDGNLIAISDKGGTALILIDDTAQKNAQQLVVNEDNFLNYYNATGYCLCPALEMFESRTVAGVTSGTNAGKFTYATIMSVERGTNSARLQDYEELRIHNGDCFVSDESTNEILRYPECDPERYPFSVATPNWSNAFSENNGIEAFDIKSDGEFIAIAEYDKEDQDGKNSSAFHAAWAWRTEDKYSKLHSAPIQFTYLSDPGFGVSSLTFLSNGGMLIVERSFTSLSVLYAGRFEVKIKYVPSGIIDSIVDGQAIKGITLVDILNDGKSGGLGYADNFEAIAAKENGDEVSLYCMTDDNRFPLQRTIMLEFSLKLSMLPGEVECCVSDGN